MVDLQTSFDVRGLTAVITGGSGQLGRTMTKQTFFDLDLQAFDRLFGLNFTGTFQCCQVFGRSMAARGQGCIVNVTSMSGLRPPTHVPACSAAKTDVANFKQWLTTYMAQEYSPAIRVNTFAPGFFLTEQNRYLLIDADGELAPRGQAIIDFSA